MISNTKKIRGLKKYHDILNRWKCTILSNSEVNLSNSNRWHEKQIIDPFYRLVRRQPPFWIQNIQLENLIEIGSTWKNIYNQANTNGRVFLWLFPDPFIQSQVVAVKDEMKSFYDGTFEPAPSAFALNPDFQKIIDKSKLAPQSKYQVQCLTEDEFAENQRYNEKHLIRTEESNGTKTYVLKIHDVFVCEF
ncbi:MAG: hypothetical protein IPO40_20690 [Fibrobacteres bacterium]|nr:hypothetical protein [Fibrobacterota bacterium]